MNPPAHGSPATAPRAPTQPNGNRRGRVWRLAGWLAGPLALLLYVQIEGCRGTRAWRATQRELAAAGESLELKDFIPPAIPDDQNLAAHPLFASLTDPGWIRQAMPPLWPGRFNEVWQRRHLLREYHPRGFGFRTTGIRRPFDLAIWERAILLTNLPSGRDRWLEAHTVGPPNPGSIRSRAASAQAVLGFLAVCETRLAEVAVAARRPGTRFPTEYDRLPGQRSAPHLSRIHSIVSVLQLRATASLAVGRGEQARDDVSVILRLADGLATEPCLYAYESRLRVLEVAIDVMWEGLATRRWSAEQLQSLQERLSAMDLPRDLRWALAGERAGLVSYLGALGRGVGRADYAMGVRYPLSDIAWWENTDLWYLCLSGLPEGWRDFERANLARLVQSVSPDRTPGGRRGFRLNVDALIPDTRRSVGAAFFRHRLLCQSDALRYLREDGRTSETQAMVDQAIVALALERLGLRHGKYPEALGELSPEILATLPNDVWSGDPQRYGRTKDGRYRLYSVGKDARDDGGVPTWRKDLVWSYPPEADFR